MCNHTVLVTETRPVPAEKTIDIVRRHAKSNGHGQARTAAATKHPNATQKRLYLDSVHHRLAPRPTARPPIPLDRLPLLPRGFRHVPPPTKHRTRAVMHLGDGAAEAVDVDEASHASHTRQLTSADLPGRLAKNNGTRKNPINVGNTHAPVAKHRTQQAHRRDASPPIYNLAGQGKRGREMKCFLYI